MSDRPSIIILQECNGLFELVERGKREGFRVIGLEVGYSVKNGKRSRRIMNGYTCYLLYYEKSEAQMGLKI